MKGLVLAESAHTAWAEYAAPVQHLPRLLRQYITMFILELHFKDRRIWAKNVAALAKALPFHKSTESELYKDLPDLFDTTGKSAPGLGYVVARYLRFNVLKSCACLPHRRTGSYTKTSAICYRSSIQRFCGYIELGSWNEIVYLQAFGRYNSSLGRCSEDEQDNEAVCNLSIESQQFSLTYSPVHSGLYAKGVLPIFRTQ